MTSPMIRLAILWHMHQPYYEDLATGEHILPWVRLHAIKDYWGMVAILQDFPGVHMTFNLVPSLLVQIQAFADARAQDRHLDVGLRAARSLDATDRAFLIGNGFHAPVDRMIRPYPRYAELHARRHLPESFTTADLRDLQVWHKLVWMDPDRLGADSRLRALVKKQRRFTEGDKRVLREVELELLKAVIPAYRDAAARGQVELSTSPFYHPILPLVCDTDVHLRAQPHSALPRKLFARSSDAIEQLQRAVELHRQLFGVTPRGVWPSEGAVSDEVIGHLASLGCRWTATDEEILARSLQHPLSAETLYRPYEVGPQGQTLTCLFRDHRLSDLIGFAYQSWDADAAADDFVAKVREAGRGFRGALLPAAAGATATTAGGEVATITVILDGENAWEHYPDGGRPFLRALYRRLEDATDIRTVTMSEAASATARRLESVFPGSWINGDFSIWAGHAEDHRAWTELAAARSAFDRAEMTAGPHARARAWEELLIAEGSDWFWWYGDDHSSDHDREFDDLFRRHLRNVYDALGLPTPGDLLVTNITTGLPADEPLRPRTLQTPTIDGAVTSVSEWVGALVVPLGRGGVTMHRVAGQLVRELRVAVDRQTLFLRLDGPDVVRPLTTGEFSLALQMDRPRRQRLDIEPRKHGNTEAPHGGKTESSDSGPYIPCFCASVAGQVVEVAVPFVAVGGQAGDRLEFSVLIADAAGRVVERQPAHHPLEIDVPSRHLAAHHWVV